ncbi:ATP-binding cassette sub-family C member 3 [Halotydeus destructor]|nr:ATP-binding cassette sub-family C member 3 [Halotydeus destructor]
MVLSCSSEIWDLNATWYSENPDFSPCFHETVLEWIPCAVLWLSAPYVIYKVRRAEGSADAHPWTLLAILKIIFAYSLTILSLSEAISAEAYATKSNPIEYYTPFIKLITFLYASVMMRLNRKRIVEVSGMLFLFWLLLFISSAVTYRSVLEDLASTNPSPEWTSSFLSRLWFTWFDDMIKLGYKRPLVMEDMYDISEEYKSSHLYEKFSKYWSYPDRCDILAPLLKTFWSKLLLAAILQLLATIFTFVSPSMLNYLLVWLASDDLHWHGVFYAAAMFTAPLVQSVLSNQCEYVTALSLIQIKTVVVSTLHRKTLQLSSRARTRFATGQIVNMMSVDSQSIAKYISSVNDWWNVPLQITVAMYLLWQQLGVATIAGVSVMILLIPVNGFMIRKLGGTYYALMKEKDQRSKLMNEIIAGIKVLKMNAWETSLSNQIKAIRKLEIVQLKKQIRYISLICASVGSLPTMVSTSSFLTFLVIDRNSTMDPSKIFVSLALFNMLQVPLMTLPSLFNSLAEFTAAKKRVNAFFQCDELDSDDIGKDSYGEDAISLADCEFSWNERGASTLQNINLNLKKGKLIAVVGTVGSGKSSLIAALLGEMERIKGKVDISGSIAYVPQQAWIQNATVKQNIVFTGVANSTRYENVLKCCDLVSDLKILEVGDETEIGEKGINLSGGQKQRVSLARAVYADRDIYLLDDPLSAVDSHVGKHIFDEVISHSGILKDKTRILVTHKVSLLPHVDEVVVMKDGQVSEVGCYAELLQRKGAFSDFLIKYLTEADDDDELAEIKAIVKQDLATQQSSSEKISPSSRSVKTVSPKNGAREGVTKGKKLVFFPG